MSASRFVSGSSILLAGWLVATFISDVPPKGYPKLDRKTATTSYPFGGKTRPPGFTPADLEIAFPRTIVR